MSDGAARKSRWWRSRQLRLWLLLGVLVILLTRLGLEQWIGHRETTLLSRIAERHYVLRDQSILASPVPATDNRARLIRAAAALVVPTSIDKEYQKFLADWTALGREPASVHVPEGLRAIADANRTAIDLAGQARNRRQSSWDADYGGQSNAPPWQDIRQLSNVIYLAALIDADAGRPDDAARQLETGLAVAASMRQEPVLIGQLIRIAIATQQFEGIKRLVTFGEPSRAALTSLNTWLDENDYRDYPNAMANGFVGEMKLANAEFSNLENGRDLHTFWSGPLLWASRPFIRLAHIAYLQHLERLLEVEIGPRPRPAIPDNPQGFWPWERLTFRYTAGIARSMDSGDLFRSSIAVTRIGVALRRYRLDRGHYPEDLNALVPGYLPAVPIDPFTGKPPVYTKVGTGFTLKGQAGSMYAARYPSMYSGLEWTVER